MDLQLSNHLTCTQCVSLKVNVSVASGFSPDLIRIAWLTHTNLYYQQNIFTLTEMILSRFFHLSPPSVWHWYQFIANSLYYYYLAIYATSATDRSRTRAWQWQFDKTWLGPNTAIIGPWSQIQCSARSQDPAHDKHLSMSVLELTLYDTIFCEHRKLGFIIQLRWIIKFAGEVL